MVDPSLKGLLRFTRGVEDTERLKLRLRALEVTKEEVMAVVDSCMMKNIEE